MGRTLSTWDDEAAEGHASGLLSDAGLDAPEFIYDGKPAAAKAERTMEEA